MGERAAVPFEEQAPLAEHEHGVGRAVAILVVDQLVDELVERGRRATHRPAAGSGDGHGTPRGCDGNGTRMSSAMK